MLTVLIGLLFLGLLITIHEGGHFLAAKKFGVYIEKFSIGFGPKLFGFKWQETDFIVSLIPLGGYVKMKGENPDEISTGAKDEFTSKKWWQKAIIAFAGPFANLILAGVLFILAFWIGSSYDDQTPVIGKINENYSTQFKVNDQIIKVNDKEIIGWSQIAKYYQKNGKNSFLIKRDNEIMKIKLDSLDIVSFFQNIYPKVDAVVGEATVGYPAYLAGIRSGDKIIEIDGKPVKDWYEMREMIKNHNDNEVTLKILRGNQILEKTMKLNENLMEENSKMIGISQLMPIKIEEKYNFWEATKYGSLATISAVYANYTGLYKLMKKPKAIKENVGGPVMMVMMSKQFSKKGISDILSFVGLISVLLMVMNLLPIPILDGGQIMFNIIEGLMKKPLSMNIQMGLQQVGLAILLFMMFFVFYSDFSRLIQRNSAIKADKKMIEQKE